MINKRSFITIGMMLLMSFTLATQGSRDAHANELAVEAEAFIREMSENAILKLTDPAISRDERKIQLKLVMEEYFHVPGIGQWVLGRFWRQASADERREYLDLFAQLLVESYVDKFASYSGETLKIIKTDVRNAKDAIVSSTLKRPALDQIIQLQWRVRANNGIYKIIDIMVEGISMGQTQRSEFASVIKHNGGNIGKFLEELRTRISISNTDS